MFREQIKSPLVVLASIYLFSASKVRRDILRLPYITPLAVSPAPQKDSHPLLLFQLNLGPNGNVGPWALYLWQRLGNWQDHRHLLPPLTSFASKREEIDLAQCRKQKPIPRESLVPLLFPHNYGKHQTSDADGFLESLPKQTVGIKIFI